MRKDKPAPEPEPDHEDDDLDLLGAVGSAMRVANDPETDPELRAMAESGLQRFLDQKRST
jgi:hypothetical protein